MQFEVLLLVRDVVPLEVAQQAAAGIVHQNAHRPRGVREASDDGGHPGVVRQVCGQHLSGGSVPLFQVRRRLFQAGPVPGDQHQVVALDSQLAGELGTQPRAGTGDEGGGGSVHAPRLAGLAT